MADRSRLSCAGLTVLTVILVVVYAYAASGPLRTITSTVSDTTGYLGLTAWILDGRAADMHEVPWRCRSDSSFAFVLHSTRRTPFAHAISLENRFLFHRQHRRSCSATHF